MSTGRGYLHFMFAEFDFYTHNGDAELAAELGIDNASYHLWDGDWTRLGVVKVGDADVHVRGAALPAQFFRFTIHRDGVASIELETGSGGLSDYWPAAEAFANDGLYAEERYRDLIDSDLLIVTYLVSPLPEVPTPGTRMRLSTLANRSR